MPGPGPSCLDTVGELKGREEGKGEELGRIKFAAPAAGENERTARQLLLLLGKAISSKHPNFPIKAVVEERTLPRSGMHRAGFRAWSLPAPKLLCLELHSWSNSIFRPDVRVCQGTYPALGVSSHQQNQRQHQMLGIPISPCAHSHTGCLKFLLVTSLCCPMAQSIC